MSDKIALLVITDGRPYLAEVLYSAKNNLIGPIDCQIMVDDSGTAAQTWRLQWEHISSTSRQGISASVNNGWYEAKMRDVDFVFLLEDDFIFNEPVDLKPMMEVLTGFPKLAQLVLRRQPWNDEEKANGTVGG